MAIFENLAKRIVRRVLGEQYTFIAPLKRSDVRTISQAGSIYSIAYLACEMAKMMPVSNLPVAVYTEKDGYPEKVPEHPLNRLVQNRWNAYMTAPEGWRWAILRRDTFGSAFIRVQWSRRTGEPIALFPLNETPNLLWNERSREAFWEVTGGDDFTPAGRYNTHEMLCLKSPVTLDGIEGQSLAKLAAENIGLSVDLEQFYHRLLTNGSHFPGYLETDDDLTLEEKQAVANSLKATSGVVEAGTVRIFDKGLHYKQNPMTMGDISLVEQQTWVLQQCCRVCRVPPPEVYDYSRATYSNIESSRLQFATSTLTDEVSALEDCLQPVLDAMGRRFPGCYVKFNLNGYMRGAYKDRMEGYARGIYAGIYTPNEVRALEELPPLEGLDEPLRPTAYVAIRDGEPVEPKNLAPIRQDMERRVRARFETSSDQEKARAFARTVLSPLADAYEVDGIPYDLDEEIERLAK